MTKRVCAKIGGWDKHRLDYLEEKLAWREDKKEHVMCEEAVISWREEYDDAKRKSLASQQFNRLDQEFLEFHNTVRQAYLDLANEGHDRIKIVDASQPLDQVEDQVYSLVMKTITSRN